MGRALFLCLFDKHILLLYNIYVGGLKIQAKKEVLRMINEGTSAETLAEMLMYLIDQEQDKPNAFRGGFTTKIEEAEWRYPFTRTGNKGIALKMEDGSEFRIAIIQDR